MRNAVDLTACPTCDGHGEVTVAYERADWNNGGYIEDKIEACPDCGGSGSANTSWAYWA